MRGLFAGLRPPETASGSDSKSDPDRSLTMTYAIIKVAGKQYRVREGERLLVDRLHQDEGSSFAPTVLLVGGDGDAQLEPGDGVVQAKVLAQKKGPKIRIGKYKKRTGYRRHTGFRASLDPDRDRVDRRLRQAGRATPEAEDRQGSGARRPCGRRRRAASEPAVGRAARCR